ncbi:MAG: (d)CMP kinase [Paludibacteraceae bacterium]|nr:(d)CMP kinase [Paludibacteraceae bacterium]
MSTQKIIVAIDGFSSCGKSTMAKQLASQIGYNYIDTGAMYRAVSLYCQQEGLMDENEINAVELEKRISSISIQFKLNAQGTSDTYLNGVNVENAIRTIETGLGASRVSELKFVRKALVEQQQAMGKEKGIVMDGRDIGTVVFPRAELKIFVTASPEVRAQRRFDELKAKGETVSFQEVLDTTIERDSRDMNRAESPLKQATDAIVLDNSHINMEEQQKWLCDAFTNCIEKLHGN